MRQQFILPVLFLFSCLFLICWIKITAQPIHQNGLFDSDSVIQITLKGDIRDLMNDRSDNSQNHPFTLSFYANDNEETLIPVEIKTRGHFRKLKENCTYPPLLIQFTPDGPQQNSIFYEQSKLKLVMPCRGDEFLVREWMVYKLYNLLTPFSFKARLVKVNLDDTRNKKQPSPFYGILLEEEMQMARRKKMIVMEKKLQPEQTQFEPFLTMAVFEYFIGNTDWSIQYLQNIKLLAIDSMAIPFAVPYDFDHAGIVSTPYARPVEELRMNSITERRYRGYCIQDLQYFEPVIARFNQLKEEFYKLYTECPLLDPKYVKTTVRYLDDFYKTINDTKAWQKDFGYPCDKNGTGNVILKGLKD